MRVHPPTGSMPARFYSLDVLRGLGALIIVFNHWPNFFFYQADAAATPALPLTSLLQPLYTNGWRAVDLFFCLSGFVFFWLYSKKITSEAVGWWEFSVLRFSRLYPLHLVTLLLAAALQLVMACLFGRNFICEVNNVFLFVLHLFFASAWVGNSVGNGVSFNGPVWSVSVEIALYVGFFLLCRLRAVSWWLLLIYIGVGFFWTIHHWIFLGIARGMLSFFAGGLAYRAFEALAKNGRAARNVKWLGAVTLGLWVLVPLEVEKHFIIGSFEKLSGGHASAFFQTGDKYLSRLLLSAYELVLFPLMLCFLALWETCRGTLGRRLAVLGDISYSTYLLHFPLQMIFLLAAFGLGIPATAFSSPLALLLFFLVLIPVSLWSHHRFERPMQSFFRKRLLPAADRLKPAAAE